MADEGACMADEGASSTSDVHEEGSSVVQDDAENAEVDGQAPPPCTVTEAIRKGSQRFPLSLHSYPLHSYPLRARRLVRRTHTCHHDPHGPGR
jgi:hypothetical protein